MASDQNTLDYVLDQIDYAGEITAKKMFGEYTLYADGKIFGLLSDNKLYIRPTVAGRTFIKHVIEAPPYPGAKLCFLIEDKIEDRAWLSKLIHLSVPELPFPKPKKKKTQ